MKVKICYPHLRHITQIQFYSTVIYLLIFVVLGATAEDEVEEADDRSYQPGCTFPGAPAHSTVVFSDENLGPGTIATYTCERGFELLGPSRRICQNNSIWLPEGIPFCGKSINLLNILYYKGVTKSVKVNQFCLLIMTFSK